MCSPISLQKPGGSDHCAASPEPSGPAQAALRPARSPMLRASPQCSTVSARWATPWCPRATSPAAHTCGSLVSSSSSTARRPSSSRSPDDARNGRACSHAHGGQHQVGLQQRAVIELHPPWRRHPLDLDARAELDARLAQPGGDLPTGPVAEACGLGSGLRGDEGGGDTAARQGGRSLAADEPGPHDHGRAGTLCCVGKPAPVGEAAQQEDLGARVHSREQGGFRAGGHHESVITEDGARPRWSAASPGGPGARPSCAAGHRPRRGRARPPGSASPREPPPPRERPSRGADADRARRCRLRSGTRAPAHRPRRTPPRR